jgi:hypothetical protein
MKDTRITTREIKFRIAMAKTAFNKKTFHQHAGHKFIEQTSEMLGLEYSWN